MHYLISTDAELRESSMNLFRLWATLPLPKSHDEWHHAVEATVGACIAIEDDLVRSGYSREQAQNKSSMLLGKDRVKNLLFAIQEALSSQKRPRLGLDVELAASQGALLGVGGEDC